MIRFLVGGAALVAMVLIGVAPATAQSGTELVIRSYLCASDPGAMSTEPLAAGCVAATGVGVAVAAADGTAVGSCVTDEGGGCVVPVPPGAMVTVTEDVSTLPAGYSPMANGRAWQTPPAPGEITVEFINIPLPLETGQPEPGGTLTIYRTSCPPGYAGDAYFADCFDNPEAGVEYSATNVKSSFFARGRTDGGGFVGFSLPAELAGNLVTIGQVPPVEVPGGAAPPFAVACTRNGGQPVDFRPSLVQLDPGGDAYNVEINAIVPGDQIRCDWYDLPPAAGPTPAASGPVTRLPNTGTGAASNDLVPGGLGIAGLVAVAGCLVGGRRRLVGWLSAGPRAGA